MKYLILLLLFVPSVAYGDSWMFADMNAGDYFEYDLCKNNHPHQPICFTVFFEILNSVYTDISNYYVASALITHDKQMHSRVFLIDIDTFEITDVDHADSYATDISETIFWLGKESKTIDLEPGYEISQITSYLSDDVSMRVRGPSYGGSPGDHTISYSVFETSEILINQNMPLPVSATVYSALHVLPEPRLLFSFQITDHSDFDKYSADDNIFSNDNVETVNSLVLNHTKEGLTQDSSKILTTNYVKYYPKTISE
jgi:hypothetical protein